MPPFTIPKVLLLLASLAYPGGGGGIDREPQQENPLRGPEELTLAQVRMDQNRDYYPDRMGQVVLVEGIVTYPPYRAGASDQVRLYIQDETGALRLLLPISAPFPELAEGDRIRARGVVGNFNGMDHLEVEALTLLASGTPLEPEDFMVADLRDRQNLGRLVRLEGHFTIRDERLAFEDETGTIRPYVRTSVFPGGEVAQGFSTKRVSVLVGILEQYDTNPPFTAGFRVTPRFHSDVRYPPPDRSWMAWVALFLLALVLAGIYWVRWRRGVRRAREREEEYIRKERERAIREEERRKHRENRMKALGRLAAGLAHDFNNLHMIILGAATLEIEEAESRGMDPGLWKDVEGACKRAAEVTQRLLAIGGRQILAPTPVEVGALIEEALPSLEGILREGLALTVRPGEEGWFMGDWDQLTAVLRDLVQNAVDAQPMGGEIRLGWELVEVKGGGGTHAPETIPGGPFVKLFVEDHGLGMSQETLDRVLDPFYSSKNFGRGHGLTLPAVNGVISQLEGHLHITSKKGEGTTVFLFFPRVDAPARRPMDPVPQDVSGRGAKPS